MTDTDLDALMPCPFCGMPPQSNAFFAWCSGPENAAHILTQQALDVWNTRARLAPTPVDRNEAERLLQQLEAVAHLQYVRGDTRYNDARAAVIAAMTRKAPDGFTLVPVEPTVGMLRALTSGFGDPTFAASWALGSFREGYQSMLAATPEAPAATGWQDISTAPRDGTVVSLKFIWNNQELQAPTLAKWSTDKARNGGPGAIADGWVGADGNPFVIQYDPTHWQPLPAAPEAPK